MARPIRPVALALVRNGGKILVEEGQDSVKQQTFSRLLGGTIEFGELGAEAVRRELREELGVESEVSGLVAAIENVFVYEGEPCHEILLVYECVLRDEGLYSLTEWEASESTDAGMLTHRLAWKHPDSFRSGSEILYPEEMLPLLADH